MRPGDQQDVRVGGGRGAAGAQSWAAMSLAAAVAVLLLVTTVLPRAGFAAEQGRVVTLGESLNSNQEDELRDYFKVSGDDEVVTVTTEDTIEAMDGIYDRSQINSAYSSTALTCRDLGDGLDVTTRNITLVNPGLYAMALVTAGMGDATLVVAAPSNAPAQGMTALAGVFKSWEISPCASGDTSKARQRLALEELTLTVQIGQALERAGTANGVQVATTVMLETQKTIVTERLMKKGEIDDAVAAQEKAAGVDLPAAERAKLVDLMTRLAKEKIDWSTFAEGWEIEWLENNARIKMTGDGIAIRNARATATAEAVAKLATAEARLRAEQTAEAEMTAEARMTAEALEAQMTADAEMTAEARATERVTPEPQPTATPMPTATPSPLGVRGTVADTDQTWVSVIDGSGMTPSGAYAVDPATDIVRDGQPVSLEALVRGDQAELTVDGSTRRITRLVATSMPVAEAEGFRTDWGVALGGMLGILWLKRRRTSPSFVVRRR